MSTNDLLSPEVMEQILSETGAMGESRQSHFINSVSHFRPFHIDRKAEDINLGFFDRAVQRISEIIQKDWHRNFVSGCVVSRRDMQIMGLTKYHFRDHAICVSFSNEVVAEPLLAYLDPDTFYFILNQYFGGGSLPHAKSVPDLTSIEENVLERIGLSMGDAFTASFQTYGSSRLNVAKVGFASHEQDDIGPQDYQILDMMLHAGDDQRPFSFAIPVSYLRAVKKRLERNERERRVSDPNWQRILTSAIMSSDVELQVNVARFDIPFEKSFQLKVGDVFRLDSCGPRVTLSILGQTQMIGKIGTVGSNYAVQIEEFQG